MLKPKLDWLMLKTQVGLANAKTQVGLANAKTQVGLANAKTQVGPVNAKKPKFEILKTVDIMVRKKELQVQIFRFGSNAGPCYPMFSVICSPYIRFSPYQIFYSN